MNTVASEPAVELVDVHKAYGTTVALDGVSFAVEPGEFFTLVGPSGCGKTTTLRLIGGFERPTSGTVRFGGRDVSGLPPEDRDVGVVFQNYALFPHMTVGENIAYGLNFSAPPGDVTDDERVSELLELVDLPGMEGRDPAALSGGQKQRIAMARALAPGPEILLLDEPMSALDAQLRERLRVTIREIQQELGITTIYVTHDQEEALAISDRVAVVNDGRIEQIGTPEQIYDEPETEFVAQFIGDNNVFTGEITAMDGTLTVDLGEVTVEVTPSNSLDGPSVGERVRFCVRPEDFVVGQERNSIGAHVESAEFLGDRTRVHLSWQGRELLALADEPLDGEVSLGFEPADAHVIPR
ncbi:MAG: ABC transporter ATP-binding protein [Halovenus sp.]